MTNTCASCRFYVRDTTEKGMGDCKNPEVRPNRIILVWCDEFYIADDFGCIFYKAGETRHQLGEKPDEGGP